MKDAPQEPTVTLAEACQRLGIDYTTARIVLSVAKRTPQGWVVAVSDLNRWEVTKRQEREHGGGPQGMARLVLPRE